MEALLNKNRYGFFTAYKNINIIAQYILLLMKYCLDKIRLCYNIVGKQF